MESRVSANWSLASRAPPLSPKDLLSYHHVPTADEQQVQEERKVREDSDAPTHELLSVSEFILVVPVRVSPLRRAVTRAKAILRAGNP